MHHISSRAGGVVAGAVLCASAILGGLPAFASPASAAFESAPLAAIPLASDVTVESRDVHHKVTTVKALDETGPVNTFVSDEIYAGFRTTFASGVRNDISTGLMDSFDVGNIRTVPADQNCLSVPLVQVNKGPQALSGFSKDRWSCAPSGISAPFTITAALWEEDTPLLDSSRSTQRTRTCWSPEPATTTRLGPGSSRASRRPVWPPTYPPWDRCATTPPTSRVPAPITA